MYGTVIDAAGVKEAITSTEPAATVVGQQNELIQALAAQVDAHGPFSDDVALISRGLGCTSDGVVQIISLSIPVETAFIGPQTAEINGAAVSGGGEGAWTAQRGKGSFED